MKKEVVAKIHRRAFVKNLEKLVESNSLSDFSNKKAIVFHGVNYIISTDKPSDIDQVQEQVQIISLVKSVASSLTPEEFVSVFPINKEYNGKRWQIKDYFYVRKYIDTLGKDSLIGEENISEFFIEYDNLKINLFTVRMFLLVSEMRRLEGKKGLLEEFAEQNGIETFTLHKDGDKEYLMDSNGRTQRVEADKRSKTHLRLIK